MEPEVDPTGSSKPLRILSLDGGGVRGLSSLLILERIMERIQEVHELEHVPRPCDHFDLIGGTSTGGIIAIMLGRLGMTVDECIHAYRNVAKQAFTPKRTSILPASPHGAFSAQALENAIKQVVREYCTEEECVARRDQGRSTTATCPHSDLAFRAETRAKTVVLAITKSNVDAAPTLFKTYDTSAAFSGCAIWQVARATSAATTFFKPIKVGRDAIEFIDAGFGYNNPCDELIREGQRVFPDHQELKVLSIGTGLGRVVTIKDTRMSIISALKSMATSSQRVAISLSEKYGDTDRYFRFNVDRGLEDITLSDWEEASTISAHTRNYLSEQLRAVKKVVDVLTRSVPSVDRPTVEPSRSDGIGDVSLTSEAGAEAGSNSNQQVRTHYIIPSLANRHFTGRESTLRELQNRLFPRENNNQRVALFGLGGVGKTQVALQLTHWVKKNMPERSIFWVPALSEEAFEQACSEIMKSLDIRKGSEKESAMELVCRHLSSDAAGQWLFIVDNADDHDLAFGREGTPGGLHRYFPVNSNGVTFLTTRFREVATSFAGSDIVELHGMTPGEAEAFLTKLVVGDSRSDKETSAQLLEELTWLPLAITQAAAYINRTNISTSRYLELMRKTKKDRMNLVNRHFHDSTRYSGSFNAVATSWTISFNKVKDSDPAAAKLLEFMAYIEPNAIPQSILPLESEEEIEFAIGTLCGYAFVTRRDNGDMFDMHSLVQLSAQSWISNEGRKSQVIESAILSLKEHFPSDAYVNREIWRACLPHALKLLGADGNKDMRERYDLLNKVAQCLLVDGRTREGVFYLTEVFEWNKSHYGEEHPERLRSQSDLALAYREDRQVQEAVRLLEHVTTVEKRILNEEHPDRLNSLIELAFAYQADGQVKQAVELLEHVLTMQEKTLGEEHPAQLAPRQQLAMAYQADGQVKRAIELLEHVVMVQEKSLGEEHPAQLATQLQLARTYQADGQVKRAVTLLQQLTAVEKKTLSGEHSARLVSHYELAMVYQANGQVKQAVELLEHLVAVDKILDEAHPDRLASQCALAKAYQADGQVKQAVKLLEQVVMVEKKTLDEKHSDRLMSQQLLAIAYYKDGQSKEAIKLLEHVDMVRARTLDEKHPARLSSQNWLKKIRLEYQAETAETT